MGWTIPAADDTQQSPDGDRDVLVLDAETLEVISWAGPGDWSGDDRRTLVQTTADRADG
jgi:hypothetical protein